MSKIAVDKSITAYVCYVTFGHDRTYTSQWLLPAESDQEAIDMAKQHVNVLMRNGTLVYGFEATREVHTFAREVGVFTEKTVLSRDGAVNGVKS